MNDFIKRIALIASLFAVTLATGCVSLSVDGDGVAVTDGNNDILATLAADSQTGGE